MIKEIKTRLLEMQDTEYKKFQCKLMPTVDESTVIGVRTPLLRAYAKELKNEPSIGRFLDDLPHEYYEENNLHGFLIEQIKDFETAVARVNAFLPYVDNWATCDLMSPKVFKKNLDRLLPQIKKWTASRMTYTVRFGVEMLMSFYLDDAFLPQYLDIPAQIKSEEYYIKMMVAWFFATALAKQYDAAVVYIENRVMDKWTHNKAIQKAVESYRITDEQKTYLRTLKVK